MRFDGATSTKKPIALGGRTTLRDRGTNEDIVRIARDERERRAKERAEKMAEGRARAVARGAASRERARRDARIRFRERFGDDGDEGDVRDWGYLGTLAFFARDGKEWRACAGAMERLFAERAASARSGALVDALDREITGCDSLRDVLRLVKVARVGVMSMEEARGGRERGGETSAGRERASAVEALARGVVELTDDRYVNGGMIASKLGDRQTLGSIVGLLRALAESEVDATDSTLRASLRILSERISRHSDAAEFAWMLATQPGVWDIIGDRDAPEKTRELWTFVVRELAQRSDFAGETSRDGLHAVDYALGNILHPMKHHIDASTVEVGRAFVVAMTKLLTSPYLSAHLFATDAKSLYDFDDADAVEDDDDDDDARLNLSKLRAIRSAGRRMKPVLSSVDMRTVRETPTFAHVRNFFSSNICLSRLIEKIMPSNDAQSCAESSAAFCDFVAACDMVLKGMERDTLLRSLVFNTDCLSRLWPALSQSRNVRDRSYRRALGVFAKMYHLYTMISDDEEFYRLEKPLNMSATTQLVIMIRNVLWQLLWTERGPDGSYYEKLDFIDEYSDAETWHSCSTALARLHDRNGRQQFTDPAAFQVRENIDITSLLQEAKEPKSRASTLLSAAPCLVPFEVRVRTFMNARKLIRQSSGVGYTGIRVRRGNLLEDGMNALSPKLTESLEGIIRVQFVNEQGLDEAGVDGGGLFKDFLNDLIAEAFDPKFGLFVETPERTLYPNPASEIHVGEKHLQYFYFLGAILGKAAYEGILLDVPLAGFFLASLKGRHIEFNDLTTLDPELYRNLVSLKRFPGDVRDLCLYFTAIDRSGMDEQEIELIPKGATIEVTNANVPRYIHCMSLFLLRAQIQRQISCFVSGFEIMMRKRWLNMFTPAELRLLISGNRTGSMDIADMAANCEYSGGYTPDHPVMHAFWQVMREITPEEQRQVLKFITSCSNTPLLGFSHLEPRLVIHRSGTAGSEAADSTADLTRLPTAATCMNLLKLPPYTSKGMLKSKLLYAVQSNSGFDLS